MNGYWITRIKGEISLKKKKFEVDENETDDQVINVRSLQAQIDAIIDVLTANGLLQK